MPQVECAAAKKQATTMQRELVYIPPYGCPDRFAYLMDIRRIEQQDMIQAEDWIKVISAALCQIGSRPNPEVIEGYAKLLLPHVAEMLRAVITNPGNRQARQKLETYLDSQYKTMDAKRSRIREYCNEIDEIANSGYRHYHQAEYFALADLPEDCIGNIAKYLPPICRAVCKLFRKYVPINNIGVSQFTMFNISQVNLTNTYYPGPIRATIRVNQQYGPGMVNAINHIAGNRDLHLTLVGASGRSREVAKQIMPTRLENLYTTTGDFVSMCICSDKLTSFKVAESEQLLEVLYTLSNRTPLQHVEVPAVAAYRMNRNQYHLHSSGSVTMSSETLRALVRLGVHFEHPPIVPNLTPKSYRRLRKAAMRPDYACAHGQGKFTMHAPQRKYANDWATVLPLP